LLKLGKIRRRQRLSNWEGGSVYIETAERWSDQAVPRVDKKLHYQEGFPTKG